MEMCPNAEGNGVLVATADGKSSTIPMGDPHLDQRRACINALALGA
jgi:hypothetical protein